MNLQAQTSFTGYPQPQGRLPGVVGQVGSEASPLAQREGLEPSLQPASEDMAIGGGPACSSSTCRSLLL